MKRGLLFDAGIRAVQRHDRAQESHRAEQLEMPPAFRELFGSSIPAPRPPASQQAIEAIGKRLRDYRNELAHGSSLLYVQRITVPELCCDLINQLFHQRS